MICNKWLGRSGRASSVISSSTLSSFGRFAAAIGAVVRPALLLFLGIALCGAGVQAQTAYFAGAQTTLASGLANPGGVALDASGNVFFTQTGSGSVGLYEIPAGCKSSSCVKTIGTSGLTTPEGLAIDASGNIYLADEGNGLLKYTLTGGSYSSPTTIANGSSSPAVAKPWGVAIDASCNVYVSDEASLSVYKFTPASSGCAATSYTNSATVVNWSIPALGLGAPKGIAVDASGSVYAASYMLSGRVYKYTFNGSSYTSLGYVTVGMTNPSSTTMDALGNLYIGSYQGLSKNAPNGSSLYVQTSLGSGFNEPYGAAVDSKGDLYVADQSNNAVYELQTQGVDLGSTAVGSTSSAQTLTFNFTNSTPAKINAPVVLTGGATGKDFAVASGGTCDTSTQYSAGGTSSCTVNVTVTPAYPGLRIGAVELVSHTSGAVIATAYVHGQGTAPQVVFNPGLIKAFAGNATGAGTQTGGYKGDGGAATSAELFLPTGAAVDGAGNTYIADTYNNVVREVSTSGTITTIAGKQSAGAGYSGDNGAATSAQLNQPAGLAVDGAGNLYIADTKNNVIREVNLSTGIITTVAGTGTSNYTGDGALATAAQLDYPTGVAVDGSGNLYISDSYNAVVREVNAASGIITTIAGNHAAGAGFSGDGGPATSAQLVFPSGLAIDSQGTLYIADSDNNAVRAVSSSGNITTVAGTGGASNAGYNGDGGASTSSKLDYPTGVVVDPAGNLFIADTDNQVIRKVSAATQNISTVAGNNTQGFAGNGGVPASAQLTVPRGLAMDSKGNLYVVDTGNNQVREIDLADAPAISFASTAVGSPSSDNPKSVTVANIGNAPLTIESAPAVAANFALDSTNTCTTADSPIAAGDSCALALDFMPTEAGAPVTGTAILTNNSLNANTSPFATQVINLSGTATAAPTSTAVTSSANPSTTNVAVTFTATVTNTASGSSTSPTGTVQFVVDGTNSGSPVSLTAATSTTSTASIQISNLTVKGSPHTIVANYLNSDGAYSDSSGSLTGGQTVNAAAATLSSLTVAPTTVPINTSATFSVTLSATSVTPIKPAGTVTFSEPVSGGSTIPLCTATLSSSAPYTASCASKALAGPTPASVSASYSDTNGNFAVATPATTTVTLTQVTTSLALSANPSTPTVDQATTLKAVLTVGSSTPNAPTGSVSFTANGVGIPGCSGTSPITLTLTGGVYGAQCTTSILTAPSSSIGATYSGDGNFTNSTAGPSTVTVNEATPVFTIAAAPVSPATTIVVNAPVQFTAAFSAPASTAPTQPKGPIVLTQGSTPLCTITDVSVSLSCQAPGSAISAAGTLTITAAYTDSHTPPQFLSKTYSNSNFTVTAGASNTALTMTGTAGVNQTATFTATVTSANSGTSTPQGTATFQITDPTGKATTICSPNVALTSGSATCSYTFALSGSYSVKATYNPNPANFVSSFGTTSVTSIPDPTALTIGAANPASPIVNQTYTLTAAVVPTYPATGAGVIAPSGSVIFYPSASSTTALCTGPVKNTGTSTAPVYTASCTTTAAGSIAAGSYTISATYTDSASPANFVTSSNTAPLVIQQDTPTVTPTAMPTSIQVNQPLTLNATVKPTYSGSFAPTGQVAFKSGSTTLCTATLSSSSGTTEAGSCTAPYQDLQVASSPYTITPAYIPDTAGSTNFKTPANSTTASVTVTAATTTVQVVPSVSAGTPGYAGQTITYTATVTTTPAFPVGSTDPGVSPTGTITFTNTSGLALAPTSCSPVTIPANAVFPYSAQCSVSYPLTYTGNSNTDTVTATYTSGDGNFTGNNSALNQPVKNFSLSYTTSTVSALVISPGNTNANEAILPNQTLATLAASTASSGTGVLTDTLAYSCIVTSTAGATSNLPTCVAAPTTAAPSASAAVAYTVTVPSGASPGQYTVTVSAVDATNAPTLIHTLTEPLNVVDTSSSGITYSYTGVFPQQETVNFGAPSSFTPTAVWCPQIQWTGTGSLPSGLPGNPFANQGTISTPGSSPTYLTCALGTSPTSGSQLSINITPIQAKQTAANKGGQKSNGSYAAVVLAMPVLIFFGWFGRNRARKSFFRMMTVLLLAWSALSISGCGGGFKLTTTGSSSAPTVLPQGNYQVVVAAQDASNNTYYAIVTASVI